MIKKMDMENICRMMEEFIKVIGKKENKMVKENFSILKLKSGKMEFGIMEKGLNG